MHVIGINDLETCLPIDHTDGWALADSLRLLVLALRAPRQRVLRTYLRTELPLYRPCYSAGQSNLKTACGCFEGSERVPKQPTEDFLWPDEKSFCHHLLLLSLLFFSYLCERVRLSSISHHLAFPPPLSLSVMHFNSGNARRAAAACIKVHRGLPASPSLSLSREGQRLRMHFAISINFTTKSQESSLAQIHRMSLRSAICLGYRSTSCCCVGSRYADPFRSAVRPSASSVPPPVWSGVAGATTNESHSPATQRSFSFRPRSRWKRTGWDGLMMEAVASVSCMLLQEDCQFIAAIQLHRCMLHFPLALLPLPIGCQL